MPEDPATDGEPAARWSASRTRSHRQAAQKVAQNVGQSVAPKSHRQVAQASGPEPRAEPRTEGRTEKGRAVCLGVPGRVQQFVGETDDLAEVDIAGVTRNVNVSLVREHGVDVGDWVLIHVGFALSVIDEDEARDALQALQRLGEQYDQELSDIASSSIT